MFTRRTATVTMSAPDASCACLHDLRASGYLARADDQPRRELAARDDERIHVVRRWILSRPADEVHDLDLVAVRDHRSRRSGRA